MVDITVHDNVREFTRNLNLFQRQQVPFATSRALNDTAVKAQDMLVKGVQIRFNNRKRWWIKGNRRTGIRVDFSSKKRLPIVASVYTNAYFAELQEDGGTKAPVNGKVLAIPTTKAPKALRRSDGVRRAKMKSNVFVSKKGVFQRMAKKKLKPLFTWARVANVKPRFKFDVTVRAAVNRWFPIYFKKRIQEAISTAKI